MPMLADAHIHLFEQGWARRDELGAYEALSKEHEIERALVVGFEGLPLHRDNNAYLARCAQGRQWIRPLAFVHPEAPFSVDELEDLWVRGFVGLSLYCGDASAAQQALAWDRDRIEWLNDHRAVVSVNAPPPAIEELAPLVGRAEGCTWLFSHLGLPGRQPMPPQTRVARSRLAPLLELAPLGHVGVKLSGYYAVGPHPHAAARPFVELLLETFGPGRLYWGSDYPPCLDHVPFARTVDVLAELGVNSGEREAIARGNLLRLVG